MADIRKHTLYNPRKGEQYIYNPKKGLQQAYEGQTQGWGAAAFEGTR